MLSSPRPPRYRARLLLCLAIGIACAFASWHYWTVPRERLSDFAQVWAAARGFLHGRNPYELVGPGRAFQWDYPLLYPFPAVLVAVPFAWLPLHLADALFVGAGAFVLAWTLTRRELNNPQFMVFGSVAYFLALQVSQWSPLLTGAALLPACGWLLACKPTSAIAVFCGYPNRRVAIGAAAFVLASVLIWPGWIAQWRTALSATTHMTPPVVRPGGVLLLLAALRWRRPEARLVFALACLPQTPVLYEALPIFLVPQVIEEAAVLAGLTYAAYFATVMGAPYPDMRAQMASLGGWTVWLVYLPALIIVLRRPNVAPQDDWLVRLLARARRFRSRVRSGDSSERV